MINEQQLPTDPQAMIELIESSYDRPALLAAIDTAQGIYNEAAAQLAEARRQLAEHEASTPDEPMSWAQRRRQLADVVPIYEQLADQAAGDLNSARHAVLNARRPIIAQIEARARAMGNQAAILQHKRVAELEQEIAAVQSGRMPEMQIAGDTLDALQKAASHLRTFA